MSTPSASSGGAALGRARRQAAGTGGGTRAPRRELADVLHLIYERDERLLHLLDEHLVLTTSQLDMAVFGALRSCQRRLAHLRDLELVDAFRPPTSRHRGPGECRWTLGRLGLDLSAAGRGEPMTTPRAAKTWLARLARRPSLSHLLGVNDLFCALLAASRRDGVAGLTRWWSERTATRLFPPAYPDGHGVWRQDGHAVGFFVEWDSGREQLERLLGKLPGYRHLAGSQQREPRGPRYPVLFCLHSHEREANLHQALAQARWSEAGEQMWPVPVATTVRPTPDPSGPVWALFGDPTGQRLRLVDLPCDHGPNTPHNPAYIDGHLAPDITGGQ